MNKIKIWIFFRDVYLANRTRCIICFSLMLTTTFFSVFLPKVLQTIIDDTMNSTEVSTLLILGSIYIGISAANVLLTIHKESVVVKIKKGTVIKYKTLLLQKVSKMSGDEISKSQTGELINLIEGDTGLLEACGIDVVFDTLANVITALSAAVILVNMQPDMFLIVVLLQTTVIWSQLKFTSILTKKTKEIREGQGSIYNTVQQYLANIFVVIMNRSKKYFFNEFFIKQRKFVNECARLDVLYVVFNQLGGFLSAIVMIFMYIYGGYKIIQKNMTIGELIAFVQYTSLFLNPCISILKSNASIQKLKVSINRIYDFLFQSSKISQNNRGVKITSINDIQFNGINFSYDYKCILKNLNFKLKKGEIYAFVGETGCGKSTIINLLFRWWDIQNGSILINGNDIKMYNLLSLRKAILVATQDVYILDETIEKNITLGNAISEEIYQYVCKCAGIDEIIEEMPLGDQTRVGENGSMISGGQKQRIALARILLNSGSVLILDEATSALDNITQSKILNNIKPYFSDKIVIIITHRLNTIQDADTIFVMKEGAICEAGTHNQLMKKDGHYCTLIEKSE